MNISLPTTAAHDIASTTGGLISDFSGVTTLIIGVLLGFWIITMIVDTIRGRAVDKRADAAIADFEDYQHRHMLD